MATAGGKRMPIDAKLRRVYLSEDIDAGDKKRMLRTPVQAYTAHITTCPQKNRYTQPKP